MFFCFFFWVGSSFAHPALLGMLTVLALPTMLFELTLLIILIKVGPADHDHTELVGLPIMLIKLALPTTLIGLALLTPLIQFCLANQADSCRPCKPG